VSLFASFITTFYEIPHYINSPNPHAPALAIVIIIALKINTKVIQQTDLAQEEHQGNLSSKIFSFY
jgi:hypothetical protein